MEEGRWGQRTAEKEEEEEDGGGGQRETLKRGGCDYEGGDAATSSYSRVERGKPEEGIRPGGDVRM